MSQEENGNGNGLKKVATSIATAIIVLLVGWLFTMNKDLATGKQWQVDHELLHRHTDVECDNFRKRIDKYVHRLDDKCEKLEDELHAK